ncbi:flagellin [Phenylobacterium sp. Root700]|uniref:flagellin n=1 Tax=Phenylobacterium sp. Root700 TaxID=1736591 RepID=UPI0006F52E2B|nr:flagellin [Phenylobacterium sp. Root700]KRB44491.1 flagellin [Phenylobacterium sp. Root700]
MSLNSVNTNTGAMIALQSLNAINNEYAQVQRRISTGLKIASAKDNPAIWAIAQNMRGESKSLDAVMSSLQRGQSVVDTALTAGESISDILSQMKEKALAATEDGLSTATRQALSDEYVALRKMINTVAANASFDGVNLISAGSTGNIRALADTRANSSIDVDHIDLSTTGTAISSTLTGLMGGVATADIDAIDAAIQKVSSALSKFGVGAKSLDRHLDMISKRQDTIDAGIGNLVDADLAKESARLKSLEVKQQLAIQALRIANQTPSLLLSLFR